MYGLKLNKFAGKRSFPRSGQRLGFAHRRAASSLQPLRAGVPAAACWAGSAPRQSRCREEGRAASSSGVRASSRAAGLRMAAPGRERPACPAALIFSGWSRVKVSKRYPRAEATFWSHSVHRFVLKALRDWNHNTAKWVSFAVETVTFDWVCERLLKAYEKEAYVLEWS